ncbi:LytR/AlgR family response regulator transcription factor [Ekhidna sp. To15]|uniref:LytR/AlgR family response regulator transcription factor n=1 Tax=Ekhidna sp. To15 TaxID=3395267 RepID=UPI003F526834
MRLLILEDEPLAIEGLLNIVHKHFDSIESIDQAQSISDGENIIAQGRKYDLIISDIRLADGLSFDLFRKVDLDIPIIFTTAYDDFALDAFECNGVAYLLKPIQENKLVQSIQKVYKWIAEEKKEGFVNQEVIRSLEKAFKKYTYKKRFLSKVGSRVVIKTVDEISLFYTENKIVYMKDQANKRYMINHSLDELESEHLNPFQFYRINRSAIVNLDSLVEMRNHENGRLKLSIVANNDDQLIVARDRVSDFREWINQ